MHPVEVLQATDFFFFLNIIIIYLFSAMRFEKELQFGSGISKHISECADLCFTPVNCSLHMSYRVSQI